ncbi:MAG: 5-formyltetrahydrofolate cyclo-ligase [Cyclobacteriaceae bacterium]
MNKVELRTSYIQKRAALSESQYLTASSQIANHFFINTDLSSTNVVHTFLPIVKKKEVDTWLIIDRVKREFPHIRFAIPKVNNQLDELEHFFFDGPSQLEENSWGIPEPTGGTVISPKNIDLVLVPLLAFDAEGNRVGYGKGYYDKFLAKCRPDCKKIGLSIFPPIANIDANDFDVKLDYCITPKMVYSFSI